MSVGCSVKRVTGKRVTYGEASGMRTGCRTKRRLEGLSQRRCFQKGTENPGSPTRE